MSEAGWWRHVRGDPSRFLLDDADPGAVWVTLTEVLDRPSDSPAVLRAREQARVRGPAAAILAEQEEGGWWGSPFAYGAHWGGSAWRLIAAAGLGADPVDPRATRGVEALLQALHPRTGGFAPGRNRPPVPCFTAELCAALTRFGFGHDARVREAIGWIGERDRGSGGWSCPDLRHLIDGGCPVAAVAILHLVAELSERDAHHLRWLAERSADWLLQHGLFLEGPCPRGWRRPGHPCLGRTDLLDALYALARARMPWTPTLVPALREVLGLQGSDGRWPQQVRAPYGEPQGSASRWTTLKAVAVVARFGDNLAEAEEE